MHKNNDWQIRQQLEQLLHHEANLKAPYSSGVIGKVQMAWQELQTRWNGAIAPLTQNSKLLNQPRQAHAQSGDFSYWYNFSWQAWVYSRLEDDPEAGRGWLEQVYRRSKSDG
ncbi:MAG: hypothetical protein WCA35_06385 [Kovacikia sp.]